MENKTTNKWMDTYYEKLVKCGISEESVAILKERYGEAINNASFSTKNEAGLAYDGSLIETALTKLAVYAVRINNLYPEDLRVDVNSIVRVALLSHISKAVRTSKSKNDWRIKNLGELYVYNQNMPAIGTGLHSVAMAMECGINLSADEIEAMCINDRANDDIQAKYYSGMLSSIIKQANEMLYVEANKKNGLIK